MIIYIFGNPDLQIDSLPIRILSQLKDKLPRIDFQVKDPNEEWEIPEELVIIDTVLGIKNIKIFTDLKQFSATQRISLHNFDLTTQLLYLQKLGKIKKIKIIGVPPTIKESEATEGIISIVKNIKYFNPEGRTLERFGRGPKPNSLLKNGLRNSYTDHRPE